MNTFEASNRVAISERDEELGRWRWPDNPNVVVYPEVDGLHWVVREDTGEARRVNGVYTTDAFGTAASDYRDAHPERKPWEDAKPGEIWVVTETGQPERAYLVDDQQFYDSSRDHALDLNDSLILGARRIWPGEDASPEVPQSSANLDITLNAMLLEENQPLYQDPQVSA